MDLIPLQRSAEYDDIERELKALFTLLYQKHIGAKVRELTLYGMPNLGGDDLISRELNNDGLALLRSTSNENIRYLFHAWRYRNPQRGTMFLETYLRALFGDVFTIDQLWCPVAGADEYPTNAIATSEMARLGLTKADCFLTSRFRVDIATEIVPERILKAAQTALAARFVLELRVARKASTKIPIGIVAYGVQIVRAAGTAIYHQPVIESKATVGPATGGGVATFVFSSIPRVDMQTYRK